MTCSRIAQPSTRFGFRAVVFLVTILFVGPVARACQTGTTINVSDVEGLYAAVNDSANAGATIVLSPGVYVLSAKTPAGDARPNAGRLELQPDMSIYGVTGDRAAVVMDMSLLPSSSFTVSLGNTSAIRLGRGCNDVEWLTIAGNTSSAAGIETDLVGSNTAQVRIAHLAAHDSFRGVDIRNIGAAMSGRRIEAEISDSEFFHAREGVRIVNITVGSGQIDATLSGNYTHDNTNGCIIENNRSSHGDLHVRSNGDRFEHNGLGCLIGGGLVATTSGAANSNSAVFEAHGCKFSNNTLTPPGIDSGGILVVGAETPGVANSASHNSVSIRLWGCEVFGNQNVDFQAFAARSIAVPTGVAGLDNTVNIELYGSSTQLDIIAVDSVPDDPSGTNAVSVIRGHTQDHPVRDPHPLR